MFNRKVAPTIQDKNNKTIELIAEKPIKIPHRSNYQATLVEYRIAIIIIAEPGLIKRPNNPYYNLI